jgi:hypothetical protein
VGPQSFRSQPSQATPASSAMRPAHVSGSCPSRPHYPGDRCRPSGVPCTTCPRRAPSACRRKDQVACRRQPGGRRARSAGDHELVAGAGTHGSQPMRSAALRSCAPVEAMCLSTMTVSLSTGGASARGATVPVSALRSESRPTPRRGPPRRRRRSRRQKARRDQRSSRTKISWHSAHSISSGADGRGSRRIGV